MVFLYHMRGVATYLTLNHKHEDASSSSPFRGWDLTNFSKHKNHSMKPFKHLTSIVFPQIYFFVCKSNRINLNMWYPFSLKWRNRRAISRGQAEAVSSDKWDGMLGHPLFLGSYPGIKQWSGAVWLIQLLLGWLLWPGDNGFIKLSPSPPHLLGCQVGAGPGQVLARGGQGTDGCRG